MGGRVTDVGDAEEQSEPEREVASPAAAIRARLLKGSVAVFVGMALGAILGLAVNGLLARLLTHNELGSYFLVFSMATIGAQFANLGMERAVVRMVAAGLGTGQPGRARAAVRWAFMFSAIGCLTLAGALVVGLGDFLARHVYHSELVAGVIVFAAGWVVATAMQALVAETFRGFQRFWLATLFSGLFVDILSVLVFGALWLGHHHASFRFVLLLTIGVTALSLLVGGSILIRKVMALGREGSLRAGVMFSVAWPLFMVNILTFMVGTGVDLWILGAFRPHPEVALYGAATRLVFFVATPLIIASQVVPPIIAELHARGEKEHLERSLREVATLAGIPASMVLLAFLFFGGSIMGFVYGSFFREGATVLAILSSTRLFAVVTGNSGALLMMTGHQRTMMVITAISAVLGVGLELVLVRSLGMTGVAIGTATSQTLQNSLQLVFGKRRLGIWTHAQFSLKPLRELIRR
jgi:O-antigen/teichoic acid export membrane protein